MNPKDIACLKFKNIHDDYIVFERCKTERALRSDPKPITVFINDDMRLIIDRLGNKDNSPNNYIFPVRNIGISPLRQYELMQLFVHFINDWIKHILKNPGINKNETNYAARHTFFDSTKAVWCKRRIYAGSIGPFRYKDYGKLS